MNLRNLKTLDRRSQVSVYFLLTRLKSRELYIVLVNSLVSFSAPDSILDDILVTLLLQV